MNILVFKKIEKLFYCPLDRVLLIIILKYVKQIRTYMSVRKKGISFKKEKKRYDEFKQWGFREPELLKLFQFIYRLKTLILFNNFKTFPFIVGS